MWPRSDGGAGAEGGVARAELTKVGRSLPGRERKKNPWVWGHCEQGFGAWEKGSVFAIIKSLEGRG